MTEAAEALRRQFEEKGVELQVYKEEHKIRLAGEDAPGGGTANNGPGDGHNTGSGGANGNEKSGGGATASSGVLVT